MQTVSATYFVELMVDPRASSSNEPGGKRHLALWRTGTSTFISKNHGSKCGPSIRTAESRFQILIFLCYISQFPQRWLVFQRKSSSHSHPRAVCPWEGQHGCSTTVKPGHVVVKTRPWSQPWVPWVRKVSWGEEIKKWGYDSPSKRSAYRAGWNCSFKTFFLPRMP